MGNFVNPIIQSMMFAAQKQQERDKMQQEADEFKESQGLRQHQLKLHEKQLENEHQHQSALLANATKQLDAQLEAGKLNNLKTARDLSLGGVDIKKAFEALKMQGGEGVPDTATLQQQEIQNIEQQAGAQVRGARTAAEPFEVAKDWRGELQDVRKSERDQANKLVLGGVEHGYAKELSDLATRRAENVARINGQYDMARARTAQTLGSEDAASHAKQLIDAAFLGTQDPKSWTPIEKKITESYLSNTGELASFPKGDFRKYNANLETVGRMQIFLKELEDLAANYSRDSEGAGGKGNVRADLGKLGSYGFVTPGSETKSKVDSMKSKAGQLVSVFQADNRISDKDVILALQGAFDPNATKQQNAEKIQSQKAALKGIVDRSFKGMSPERREWVMGQLGIDLGGGSEAEPEFLKLAPKADKMGRKLNVEASKQAGKPLYGGQ